MHGRSQHSYLTRWGNHLIAALEDTLNLATARAKRSADHGDPLLLVGVDVHRNGRRVPAHPHLELQRWGALAARESHAHVGRVDGLASTHDRLGRESTLAPVRALPQPISNISTL